jgi:hypothetical protein
MYNQPFSPLSCQRFFQCGLGYMKAAHHWTHNITSDKPVKIGKCMEDNLHNNRSIFQGCGDFKIWTDTGYMDDPKPPRRATQRRNRSGKHTSNQSEVVHPSIVHQQKSPGCFYPTLHGGLEHFFHSHPTGTILNVIRDAGQWYDSAMSWRKLPERLAKQCVGFPSPDSSREVWMNFYKWHTQHLRDFAQQHPSLAYLEVSLEAPETGEILQNHTGIPDFCWGNCNPDPTNGNCGVLGRMERYKVTQEMAKRQKQKPPETKLVHRVQRDRKAKTTTSIGDTQNKQETGPGTAHTDAQWQVIQEAFDLLKNIPVEGAASSVRFR